jgi:hypothetical protein
MYVKNTVSVSVPPQILSRMYHYSIEEWVGSTKIGIHMEYYL